MIGFISILSDLFSFFMKKRRAKDFAISIILFIFSIYYSIGVYNLIISIQETENYLSTKGKILENEIRWTGEIASKRPSEFYLHLKYSYISPDGFEQIGTYTYLYKTDLPSWDKSRNFVKQYPIGSEITVFYNPKNPQLSCLFPGFDGGMDWYLYFEIIDLVIVILLIYVSIRFLYLGITDKGPVEKYSKLIQQKVETNFKDQVEILPSKTKRMDDGHFHIFTVRWMSYLMLIVLSMPIFVSIGFVFFIEDMKIYFYFKIETLRS
ncbi:PF12158 family protein [Leptospira interrogans serovar Bataviae str. HAI135]|nr:PF12158 family protein [Leptospira interrogans serovar Bataviae str. HAI135]